MQRPSVRSDLRVSDLHRRKGQQAAYCVSLYTHKACSHTFEQARGGSGAWYAMELTELLPHIARGLNIDWDEATRYAGLKAE